MKKSKWLCDDYSKEAMDATFDILYNGKTANPAHLKSKRGFGTVDWISAGFGKGSWTVKQECGFEETFASLEEMINAGWVLD